MTVSQAYRCFDPSLWASAWALISVGTFTGCTLCLGATLYSMVQRPRSCSAAAGTQALAAGQTSSNIQAAPAPQIYPQPASTMLESSILFPNHFCYVKRTYGVLIQTSSGKSYETNNQTLLRWSIQMQHESTKWTSWVNLTLRVPQCVSVHVHYRWLTEISLTRAASDL